MSVLVVGSTCVVAAPCEKPTIARCTLGMTIDDVKTVLSTVHLEDEVDGTHVAIAKIPNPIPQVRLTDGALRITFDSEGRAVALWYRATTVQSEQEMLKAAEGTWGDSLRVRGSDGVN